VHSYVSAAGPVLRRDWGYIGMYTGSDPAHWSAEVPLLGWQSDSPLSTAGVAQVLTAIPELADCVLFTEPGVVLTSGGLDLALACYSVKAGVIQSRVVLLRSTDHARSFSWVSTLVSASDFACLGGALPEVTGPDLFLVNGAEYLTVSPVGPVSHPDASAGYRGCLTMALADADAGTITRGPNGAPTVLRSLQSSDGRFAGPCTYAQGATALGQVLPMQFSDDPPRVFRIFRTTVPVP